MATNLIPKVSKRKKALLDANLLLPYLIQRLGIDTEKFQRTKSFTQEDVELLNDLIIQFGGLCSTPHVITEVSNLAGKLREDQTILFRTLLAQYVEIVEEFSISSKEVVYSKEGIYSPTYLKFGITDAVLFAICQREKIVLVTLDLPLTNYAEKNKLEVINFNHRRQKQWGIR